MATAINNTIAEAEARLARAWSPRQEAGALEQIVVGLGLYVLGAALIAVGLWWLLVEPWRGFG